MAAREHRVIHNVEQTKKMIPLITCEAPVGQHVSEFVFGVNMFDLDLWFYIDSVEQPVKCNSVESGHVSHCWSSAFDDNLDHSLIIFKDVQLRLALSRMCVCGYVVHI